MRPPTLAGTIERRLLVNYRADPDVVRPHLPDGFTPDVVRGHAIIGICLIELRIRPAGLPRRVGFRSFNGAHRYAVIAPDGQPAVYIPRRDTNSTLVALAGGRIFPGSHHRARVVASEDHRRLTVALHSRDDEVRVVVAARLADRLPPNSVFSDAATASAFFERANVGYSATPRVDCLDAVALETTNWSVTPLTIDRAESTYFDDAARFPRGSIA
ncbi:MAG: DUF2071 domain-containing protein, partial [Acidimicrobiales bacterium]|nr:DUF2071 domain-containing protein [Acidimicrobiales bacterium]